MRKIYIAGHKGLVGSAIYKYLYNKTNFEIITRDRIDLDLCDQEAVIKFFKFERPDEVILAAAKVGGIHANNTYPAEFIYQNLQIQNNVIHAAHLNDVNKLLFLGSSCIYPVKSQQPISERELLKGPLEQTNEPYAIAKIAGIKMCESYNRQYGRDYRCVMPTNLYGPGDNYHDKNSHVIPALIKRFHEAKVLQLDEVVIWGTGSPKREFLYVSDMVEASLFIHDLDHSVLMSKTSPLQSHINIGSGSEITIRELANTIKEIVGFKGLLKFDTTKLDGAPRKLLNIKCISELGWKPKINLKNGLINTYSHFIRNSNSDF